MRQINLIKHLRIAIVIIILSVSAFTLNSCNGCNSSTKSDEIKDSTTTTSVSDSSKMRMDSTNKMMDTRKDTSSKGDQLPPPK